MNQMVQMLMESNARMKMIMNAIRGKKDLTPANHADITIAQREYELQIKQINQYVQAFTVASKNKRTMMALDKMGIMDETTTVEQLIDDKEYGKVKCPYHDNLITRAECLDYSGSHHDECSGCETGKVTKNMLLGGSGE